MSLAGPCHIKRERWWRGSLAWAMPLGRMRRHRWIKALQSPEPLCCCRCADPGVLTSLWQTLQWVPDWDAQLLLSHLLVVWLCQVSPAVQSSHLTLGRDFGVSPITWAFCSIFKHRQSELKPAARKVHWYNALHYASLHLGKTYSPDGVSWYLPLQKTWQCPCPFSMLCWAACTGLDRGWCWHKITWWHRCRGAPRCVCGGQVFHPCEQRGNFVDINSCVFIPVAEAKADAIDHSPQRNDCVSDACWGWLRVPTVSVFAPVALTDQTSSSSGPIWSSLLELPRA